MKTASSAAWEEENKNLLSNNSDLLQDSEERCRAGGTGVSPNKAPT